jgi:hypothetical protein
MLARFRSRGNAQSLDDEGFSGLNQRWEVIGPGRQVGRYISPKQGMGETDVLVVLSFYSLFHLTEVLSCHRVNAGEVLPSSNSWW